jgi:hypothetical protein
MLLQIKRKPKIVAAFTVLCSGTYIHTLVPNKVTAIAFVCKLLIKDICIDDAESVSMRYFPLRKKIILSCIKRNVP